MVPSVGAYGYEKYRKSHSEPVKFSQAHYDVVSQHLLIFLLCLFSVITCCLQCFDPVGQGSGRASDVLKLSAGMVICLE